MTPDPDPFGWIKLVGRRGKAFPAPDTDAELDAAERLLGARLPASYRAFARRFGLGGRLHSLPTLLRLTPVLDKREPHWADSVVDAAKFWRSPAAVEQELPAEFLRHAIVFGCDEGMQTFLFHTGEVTDPAGPEYRVYQIPRHCGPEPICESFAGWLRWVHERFDPATWGDDDDDDVFDDKPFVAGPTMPYDRSAG